MKMTFKILSVLLMAFFVSGNQVVAQNCSKKKLASNEDVSYKEFEEEIRKYIA